MIFIFENLVKLYKESGKSQNKFFSDADLSTATMRTCDPKGRGSELMLSKAQQLANHYGHSVLSLYELNELDAEYLVSHWNDVFNILSQREIEENGIVMEESTLTAPYVGDAAANPAGLDNPPDLEYDLGEYGEHQVHVPKRFFDENGIFVKVQGDSMEPTLHDGELVYVSPNRRIENGQVGFFRVDDKTLIKRLYRVAGSEAIILKSDNEAHKPIVISDKGSIQHSGLVVQAVRKIL